MCFAEKKQKILLKKVNLLEKQEKETKSKRLIIAMLKRRINKSMKGEKVYEFQV